MCDGRITNLEPEQICIIIFDEQGQLFNYMTYNGECACVANLGVIWLDPHNFRVRSHGQLLSMTSLVRVLPASAYTSNMVPNI